MRATYKNITAEPLDSINQNRDTHLNLSIEKPLRKTCHSAKKMPIPNKQERPLPPRQERSDKSLDHHLKMITNDCIECGLCVKECLFLQQNGTPKEIAVNFNPKNEQHLRMPFDCSLCKLCDAVCPVDLSPGSLFFAMRREAVRHNFDQHKKHCPVLSYEKRGLSKFLTFSAFPKGCETIFFPGCSLPGTRANLVSRILTHLQQFMPNLGIMLNCCTKPSHDLGLDEQFSDHFFPMTEYLLDQGIKTVIVACPNCYKIFNQYGGPLETKNLYTTLADHPCPTSTTVTGTVTIHDPCATRNNPEFHDAVRKLAAMAGLSINEMKHHGKTTFCCGEGGSVGCQTPGLAKAWTNKRTEEAKGGQILSYCAGCVNFLSKDNKAFHILDLLCEPEKTMAGKVQIAKSPFTYFHRWQLKRQLQKRFADARKKEGPFPIDHITRA